MQKMNRANRRGASVTSYGLVVGLIAVFGIAAVTSVGSNVTELFTDTDDALALAASDSAVSAGASAQSTPSSTLASCAEILAANPSASSGIFTIDPDGSGGDPEFSTHCDMDTDGGGWTRFFAFSTSAGLKNPSSASFPGYWFEDNADHCPDIDTECLRMLPSSANTSTDIMAVNSHASYKWNVPGSVMTYFQNGTIPSDSCATGWTGCALSNVTRVAGDPAITDQGTNMERRTSAPVNIVVKPGTSTPYNGFLTGGGAASFGSCGITFGSAYVGCGDSGMHFGPATMYYR
ncbi:MAG: hypothetical protein Alpg2KO_32090 [Alphaproteobacteria bacterium]